jgi:hypothetical protein
MPRAVAIADVVTFASRGWIFWVKLLAFSQSGRPEGSQAEIPAAWRRRDCDTTAFALLGAPAHADAPQRNAPSLPSSQSRITMLSQRSPRGVMFFSGFSKRPIATCAICPRVRIDREGEETAPSGP